METILSTDHDFLYQFLLAHYEEGIDGFCIIVLEKTDISDLLFGAEGIRKSHGDAQCQVAAKK